MEKSLMHTRLYFGPMSKNIVDSLIEITNELNILIGLIPSRRQVDFNDSGYVNFWTTETFSKYVRGGSTNIILERDHGGPSQGLSDDDGLGSFAYDSIYLDMIHVDVWKKYKTYEQGLQKTIEYIKFCHKINPNILFEVGTEEAIRRFSENELKIFLFDLEKGLLPEEYEKIKYLVIQSGTALRADENIGNYEEDRLLSMIELCKEHSLLSKEHNGDFLPASQIKKKLDLGLDAINIAPELGQAETDIILSMLTNDEIDEFFKICLESGRWKKWVPDDFIPEENKLKLIKICGHYVFSDKFIMDFYNINNIKSILKNKLKSKIVNILNIVY